MRDLRKEKEIMKKITAAFFVLLAILCLAACKSESVSTGASQPAEKTVIREAEPVAVEKAETPDCCKEEEKNADVKTDDKEEKPDCCKEKEADGEKEVPDCCAE